MTAFISYSGSRTDRAELVKALRECGVTPWRDVESLTVGARTTDEIELELSRCSSAIVWINDDIFDSEYVANVELPAISRAARTRGMRIVPVFDGMSPEMAAERFGLIGIEIGDSNGHLVDAGERIERTSAAIAARCAQSEVRASRDAQRSAVVRAVTYDDTASHLEDAVLNLDWRHCFDRGRLVPQEAKRLESVLSMVAAEVKSHYGASEIVLAAKVHLPVAVALGRAFAEPTGCTLRMERLGETCFVHRDVPVASALEETLHPLGPVSARIGAVEVAVSRETEEGVNTYAADGHRYRRRVKLTAPDGPGRFAMDLKDCNGWARQIGEVLTSIAARREIDAIDLFLACPIELAVAIGWWTNAAGSIALLDRSGPSGMYRPMWHLG